MSINLSYNSPNNNFLHEGIMDMRSEISVGTRFTRLTVISNQPLFKNGFVYYKCRCDCGKERVVRMINLIREVTRSCGCLGREKAKIASTTHGKSKTPEHGIWKNMNRRCDCPSATRYKNYGGRGIKVCDRWKHSFENFYEDMGPRPSPKHTLERKNNDDNYKPDNCVWATKAEQANNTSRNHWITYNGETKTLSQWTKDTGILCLRQRINNYNMPLEKAFQKGDSRERLITYQGKTQSVKKWAQELGIEYTKLIQRIQSGMEPERAFINDLRKARSQ